MSQQPSKHPPDIQSKKGEGLSKSMIQKMAEEFQSIQSNKQRSS